MYRLRFEKLDQIFEIPGDAEVVLPLSELFKCAKDPQLCGVLKTNRIIAEIPAVLWEHSIEKTKNQLIAIKSLGICDAICENIGAFNICKELDFSIHGGMYLNVLNSSAIEQYKELGSKDLTISFEMPLNKMRLMLSGVNKNECGLGMIVYGYLPLMKFRACPAMGRNGCRGCTKDKYLTDRKGESFRIFCRNSEYSELLNCVPLYAADRSLPDLDFYTLYFTVEDKKECSNIFNMICIKKTPEFRRTFGLYGRELL